MFVIKFYSYLNALNVFIFEIFIAGMYEANAEIISEITKIIGRKLLKNVSSKRILKKKDIL